MTMTCAVYLACKCHWGKVYYVWVTDHIFLQVSATPIGKLNTRTEGTGLQITLEKVHFD